MDNIKIQIATFAAGCFWHVEEAFTYLKGVISTTVGYTGGHVENPSYKEVCADATGHAEAVQVQFDPKQISYDELLKRFWKIHDPTQLNRQGPDVGAQYRSAIFYHNKNQKKSAIKSRYNLQKSKNYWHRKIVTEVVKISKFYPAEAYHQKYLQKNKLQKVC